MISTHLGVSWALHHVSTIWIGLAKCFRALVQYKAHQTINSWLYMPFSYSECY